MSIENQGERPREVRILEQSQRPEQAGPGQKRTAETPQGRPAEILLWQQTSGEDRQHAQLVAACRNLIHRRQQELGDDAKYFPSAKMIKDVLARESLQKESSKPDTKQYGEACHTLLKAWDVIAFKHYGAGSTLTEVEDKKGAVDRLDRHCEVYGTPIIRLSESQVHALDALAEAAEIPHLKGQTEIHIPEELRDYEKWQREQGRYLRFRHEGH